MISIIIADDHSLIREGLKRIVANELDLQVVAEATNGDELISQIQKYSPDLIVIDITMPGRSGFDVIQFFKHSHPELKFLVLSLHPEETMAARAFEIGASGYIIKESAPEELLKAIRKVASGGKYVSTEFAERMAMFLQHPASKNLHDQLSSREFEVLCKIGVGKTVNEIAKELSLSVATVNTYRARILEKMMMKTTAELIHYAVKAKLVN